MSTAPDYNAKPTLPFQELSPLTHLLAVEGKLSHADGIDAEVMAIRAGIRVADVLQSCFDISAYSLAEAYSTIYQAQRVNPTECLPDAQLLTTFGPARALSLRLLPWQKMGTDTIILTDRPDHFDRHIEMLREKFGPVRLAITTRDEINSAITNLCAASLARGAETRVAASMSSRNWNAPRAMIFGLCVLFALVFLFVEFPTATFQVFCIWAIVMLALNMGLKVAAALACISDPKTKDKQNAIPARLPKFSLLIPLYRETEIAEHLLERLLEIDYPKELLDVCLITEREDSLTRAALGRTVLPTWIRPIVVPDGSLRTKPRALNYALDFTDGSIIGVYDAEDAPAPDQLRRVAEEFANCGPRVACIQGVLDYYNDSTNWLTRCFTVEYATWFRVVLPGLERLKLVVPLGGTTLFFKRDVLENLGGWDAHNVTEDADLGVRLARAGYSTKLVDTVTQEEANGRFWPWVKQRSRWLKGYAITYAVHMRSPVRLWRDLGTWRFFGVQMLFAGTLSQFVLAPILLTFWLIPFGVPHPFADAIPVPMFWGLVGLLFVSEVTNLLIAALALEKAKKTWLIKWAVTLQFYFPLAAVAAYKGLFELAWKPFYWDKTVHGVLLPTRPPQPPLHPASDA